MNMFHGECGGYGFMGFSWLSIFIILAIVLVFFFLNNKKDDFKKKNTAQDILDQKYAKGEIDLEEYQERSSNLAR